MMLSQALTTVCSLKNFRLPKTICITRNDVATSIGYGYLPGPFALRKMIFKIRNDVVTSIGYGMLSQEFTFAKQPASPEISSSQALTTVTSRTFFNIIAQNRALTLCTEKNTQKMSAIFQKAIAIFQGMWYKKVNKIAKIFSSCLFKQKNMLSARIH